MPSPLPLSPEERGAKGALSPKEKEGKEEARALLEKLAKGDRNARQTQEAESALKILDAAKKRAEK
jgi:hypothetical protein